MTSEFIYYLTTYLSFKGYKEISILLKSGKKDTKIRANKLDTNFSGLDFSGLDPSGLDPSGLNPSGLDLSGLDTRISFPITLKIA
jgi:hypothetical protein